MYAEIFPQIRTTEDIRKIKDEIGLLLDALYQGKGEQFEIVMGSYLRQWVAEAIKKDLAEAHIEKEKYLKDMLEKLQRFKILSLTMAFEPAEKSIDSIFRFVRKNIGTDIILEFTYNPGMLGGAVLIYQGEYKDFSLIRVFESEIDKKKEEIIKMLIKDS